VGTIGAQERDCLEYEGSFGQKIVMGQIVKLHLTSVLVCPQCGEQDFEIFLDIKNTPNFFKSPRLKDISAFRCVGCRNKIWLEENLLKKKKQ